MVAGGAETTQESGLRKEYVDSAIKAIVATNYKLKTLCSIESSSAWTESYFRESSAVLTGGGVASPTNINAIPRLAPFPYGQVVETKISALISKYGMEGMISFEDEVANHINLIARTLVKIGEAVTVAVDTQILALMSASFGNTYPVPVGSEWDSATVALRDPVFDILSAMETIRYDNIDPLVDGYLVVNGTDYTNLMCNSKVVNNPSFKTADVVSNGTVGNICGLKIMVSEVVAADTAYIVMKNRALVWKETVSLKIEQIKEPGIKTTIRAFCLGVAQMQVPNGVCKITNTRK